MRVSRRRTYKSFDESMVLLLNNLELYLNENCPILRKLIFRSQPDEIRVLRKAVSLPIGVIIGYVFHHLIIQQFPYQKSLEQETRIAVVLLVAFAYVLSVQIRVMVWLIIPSMLTGPIKVVVLVGLLVKMFTYVTRDLIENLRHFIWMMACIYIYRIKNKFQHWAIQRKPIDALFLKLKGQEFFGQDAHNSKEASRDSMKNMKGLVGDIQNDVVRMCKEQILAQVEECVTMIMNFLSWLDSIDFLGLFRWVIRKLCKSAINKIANHACDSIGTAIDEGFSAAKDDFEKNTDIGEGKDMNYALDHKEKAITDKRYGNLMDMQRGVNLEIEMMNSIIEDANSILTIVIIVMFFIGVIKANRYHHKYHTDLAFDNKYVDRYFRRIDTRRTELKKIHLLPLRAQDLKEMTHLFSLTLSEDEKKEFGLIWKGFVGIVGIGVVCMFVNFVIADAGDIFYENFNFTIVETILYQYKPKFTGGIFANVLSKMLLHYEFDYKEVLEFDVRTCVEPSLKLTPNELINLITMVVVAFSAICINAYLTRSRMIICDYFYPRYAKCRTLRMYNARLLSRKEFLAQRKDQLEKIAIQHRVYDDDYDFCYIYGKRTYTKKTPFLIRYVLTLSGMFTPKLCFVCISPCKMPFIYCDIPTCHLLYCQYCWDDCNQICVSCKTAPLKMMSIRI